MDKMHDRIIPLATSKDFKEEDILNMISNPDFRSEIKARLLQYEQ